MDILSRIFKKKDLRKDPRVRIQNFHKITFWDKEKEFEVYNVSIGGIGFLTDVKNQYKQGDHFHAVVKVLDEMCDIEVEVRQHTKYLVGCKVIGSCEVYENFVKQYFESELNALNLKLIEREKLADDENGEPHWLYGDYNHEIYFTTNEKNDITTLQLNYHGFMFLSDRGKTTTGIVYDEQKEDISYKAASLVKESEALPKDMMEFMFRFVDSASKLESAHKKQILDIMRKRFKYDWSV